MINPGIPRKGQLGLMLIALAGALLSLNLNLYAWLNPQEPTRHYLPALLAAALLLLLTASSCYGKNLRLSLSPAAPPWARRLLLALSVYFLIHMACLIIHGIPVLEQGDYTLKQRDGSYTRVTLAQYRSAQAMETATTAAFATLHFTFITLALIFIPQNRQPPPDRPDA